MSAEEEDQKKTREKTCLGGEQTESSTFHQILNNSAQNALLAEKTITETEAFSQLESSQKSSEHKSIIEESDLKRKSSANPAINWYSDKTRRSLSNYNRFKAKAAKMTKIKEKLEAKKPEMTSKEESVKKTMRKHFLREFSLVTVNIQPEILTHDLAQMRDSEVSLVFKPADSKLVAPSKLEYSKFKHYSSSGLTNENILNKTTKPNVSTTQVENPVMKNPSANKFKKEFISLPNKPTPNKFKKKFVSLPGKHGKGKTGNPLAVKAKKVTNSKANDVNNLIIKPLTVNKVRKSTSKKYKKPIVSQVKNATTNKSIKLSANKVEKPKRFIKAVDRSMKKPRENTASFLEIFFWGCILTLFVVMVFNFHYNNSWPNNFLLPFRKPRC